MLSVHFIRCLHFPARVVEGHSSCKTPRTGVLVSISGECIMLTRSLTVLACVMRVLVMSVMGAEGLAEAFCATSNDIGDNVVDRDDDEF